MLAEAASEERREIQAREKTHTKVSPAILPSQNCCCVDILMDSLTQS